MMMMMMIMMMIMMMMPMFAIVLLKLHMSRQWQIQKVWDGCPLRALTHKG